MYIDIYIYCAIGTIKHSNFLRFRLESGASFRGCGAQLQSDICCQLFDCLAKMFMLDCETKRSAEKLVPYYNCDSVSGWCWGSGWGSGCALGHVLRNPARQTMSGTTISQPGGKTAQQTQKRSPGSGSSLRSCDGSSRCAVWNAKLASKMR